MYAAKEFDNSDELFFERLSDAWFIVDQIRRGLKADLIHNKPGIRQPFKKQLIRIIKLLCCIHTESHFPHSPLLQMYDSIVQQLIFLRDLIEGKEKDKAKLWKQ
jgi:hypothetical protein